MHKLHRYITAAIVTLSYDDLVVLQMFIKNILLIFHVGKLQVTQAVSSRQQKLFCLVKDACVSYNSTKLELTPALYSYFTIYSTIFIIYLQFCALNQSQFVSNVWLAAFSWCECVCDKEAGL